MVLVQNSNYTAGYRVQLRLRITQHIKDKTLMLSIIKFLGTATLNDYPNSQKAIVLNISSFKDITNIVIPFIEKGILLGGKRKDYLYWKDAYTLMSQGKHLSKEGIKEIMRIKTKMVNSRYNKDHTSSLN